MLGFRYVQARSMTVKIAIPDSFACSNSTRSKIWARRRSLKCRRRPSVASCDTSCEQPAHSSKEACTIYTRLKNACSLRQARVAHHFFICLPRLSCCCLAVELQPFFMSVIFELGRICFGSCGRVSLPVAILVVRSVPPRARQAPRVVCACDLDGRRCGALFSYCAFCL